MASTLVIDAGNSSTTIALFRDGQPPRGADGQPPQGAGGSVPVACKIEAASVVRGGISAARGECAVAIRRAFAAADATGEVVARAMLASVTPAVNGAWERLVREEAGLVLDFVRHDMPLPFRFGYAHPETTGADRLADMAAAAILYGAPALVIDIGTAVTYDLLSAEGVFFTGVIGPGPEILARSLHDYTALLPLVEWWKKSPPAVPSDTEGAMLFGIDAGFCGVFRETVSRLLPLLGSDPRLVATGGFAERFAPPSGFDFAIDPFLTLKGIGLLSAAATRKEATGV